MPGAWQAVAPQALQKIAEENPFDPFSLFHWGIVKSDQQMPLLSVVTNFFTFQIKGMSNYRKKWVKSQNNHVILKN